MNEIQGGIGLAQLRKLNRVLAAQRKNKAVIEAFLAPIPGLKFRAVPDPKGDSATHLAFNLPTEKKAKTFQKALAAEGIGTTCFKDNFWHYVPNWEHFLAKSTAQKQEPLHGSAKPEGGLQPQGDSQGRGSPRPDPHPGDQREDDRSRAQGSREGNREGGSGTVEK